jgi:hypothetical protein
MRLRLRFQDAALERAFLTEYAALDRRRYLFVLAVATSSVVAFPLANAGTPEEIRLEAHWQHAIALPAMFALLAFGFAPRAVFVKHWQTLTAMLVCLALSAVSLIFLDLGAEGLGASPELVEYGAGIVGLFVVAFFTLLSLRFASALVAAVIPATLFFASLWLVDVAPGGRVRAAYFACAGLALGALAGFQLERLRRAEFQRRHELLEERAKTESQLKLEISHQVAARSRQLGENLVQIDAAADTAPLEPGVRFDARYRIIKPLGSGGMGAVYEVERLTDGRRLALKIVSGRISRAVALRFAREAEIGARVHHAHLVSIVDVGVASSGAPFLVMELVVGRSLEDCRPEFGNRAWAIPLLRQIASGLVALHDAGVVHRDLKPANILVQPESDGIASAKISDFGISRLDENEASVDASGATIQASTPSGARLTGTGALLGTPLYMAPEAARGMHTADASVDVFAFGILAYEMLAARTPFEVPPVLLSLARQPIPRPAALGTEDPLSICVLQCLAEGPTERPTMRSVREVLNVTRP